ncbi:MAG: type I-G CRISPR-associated protein Csb2 [Pseudonocardiaceae bacterium]
MPTTLVLRFPSGRYRATPWDQHVNTVELPPSPWRLLRALYAVWRTRAPGLDEQTVGTLLARLAEPPTFHVPRFGVVVFERAAELAAVWPFELTAEQRAVLERLAGAIPYFGRADSLCEGLLPPQWVPESHDTWVPLDVADSVDEDDPVTSVLAPELPLQLDALLARPVDVRKGGLLFPVGTHLLAYQQVGTAPRVSSPPRSRVEPVTAVRLSVLQAGLPPQTDSLIYTDLLRQGALSKLARLPEERARTQLGGRMADGKAMEGHGHAHFLPLITDRRLVGLVIWAPNGLPEDELKAVTKLDKLYSPVNPDWKLTIRIAEIGTPAQVVPELTSPSPGTVWQSATPFTPPRHSKRNVGWLDYIRTEVDKELMNRGLPALRGVTLLDGEWQPWRRYRPSARMRRDTRQGQATRGSAFLRIELTEPTCGPLALGHLSHFGLGLFVPAHER